MHLVNSASDEDPLADVQALREFVVRFSYSGVHTGTVEELDEVRALRPDLRTVLTAERDEAVSLVNDWLHDADAVPRLVRHDGWDWHIHAVPAEAPLATRIRIETAMAMIDLIRADEMSRLAICADPTCDGVVWDLSRNRSRRFCSTTCGNRVAQAAHRSRRSRRSPRA